MPNMTTTAQNFLPQTSLDPLQLAAAVVADGGYTSWNDALDDIQELIAAGFDASKHPRGKDGRFIKKGFFTANIIKILQGAKVPGMYVDGDFTSTEKDSLAYELSQLTPKQWNNLKEDQKQQLTDAADKLLDEGVPYSATAVTQIEELTDRDNTISVSSGVDDVFNPSTPLPAAPTEPTHEPIDLSFFTPKDIIKFVGKIDKKSWNALHDSEKKDLINGVDQAQYGNVDDLDNVHSAMDHLKKITGDDFYELYNAYVTDPFNSSSTSSVSQSMQKLFDVGSLYGLTEDDENIIVDEFKKMSYDTFKSFTSAQKDALNEFKYDSNATDSRFHQKYAAFTVDASTAKLYINNSLLSQAQKDALLNELSENDPYYAWEKFTEQKNAHQAKLIVKSVNVKVDTPVEPVFTPSELTTVANAVQKAEDNKQISHDVAKGMFEDLQDGIDPQFVQAGLDDAIAIKNEKAVTPSKATIDELFGNDDHDALTKEIAAESAAMQKTTAFDSYSLDELQKMYDKGLMTFEEFNAAKANKSSAVTPTGSSVTKPTKIKITHALIHAKHQSGDVIAMHAGVKVTWNGKSYDIIGSNGTKVSTGIAKSKLYAHLVDKYPNKQWWAPGKQENEAINAPSMAATKPAENPIPHPVNNASTPHLTSEELSKQLFKGLITKDEYDKLMIQNGHPPDPLVEKYGPKSPVKESEPSSVEDINKALFAGDITGDKYTELMAKYGHAEPEPEPEPEPSIIPTTPGGVKDLTGWKKVGSQGGSNLGGMYAAPNGVKYYVKKPKTDDHVQNEVLAASLYKAAGIDVPEVTKGTNSSLAPGLVVVSKIIEGKNASVKLSTPVFKAKAQQGFAVDAWLANWDTVGLSKDNIIDVDGKPVRIDAGGSLNYRAQGNKKTFSSTEVPELDTLRDASKNPQAASVFGDMSVGQQRESAKMLLNVTDEKISQLVQDAGYTGIAAIAMFKTLRDRRKIILEKYDLLKNDKKSSKIDVTSTVAPTPTPTPSSTFTPIPEKKGLDLPWLDEEHDLSPYQQQNALNYVNGGTQDDWDKLSSTQQEAITNIIDEAIEDEVYGAEDAHFKLLGFANVNPDDVALSPTSVAPTITTGATTTLPSSPSIPTGLPALSSFVKQDFYNTFKAQKVSPAWSGAKIYASLQIAKQKMSGNPIVAGLTDGEMLDLVDQQLKMQHPGKYSGSPYKDKVVEWLKTPNGKKAALKAKSATPHTAPIKSTTSPTSPAWTSATPAAPTPVIGKTPIPGAQADVTSVLAGNADVSSVSSTTQIALWNEFKAKGAASYLSADPETLFKGAQEVAKNYNISAGQALKIIDIEKSKKLGVTNAFMYEQKVKTWLSDPANADSVMFTYPFDADKMLKHNAPSASTIVPLASQPTGSKADVLAKSSSDFKIISTSTALSWAKSTVPLTTGQKADLKYYTTNAGYAAMNGALRGKTKPSPALLKRIQSAQDGMRPLDNDVLLHRGTGFSQFGNAKNAEDVKKLIGKTVQDKAFLSASVGGSAAFGGQVKMEIEVPKGTGAMFVDHFSAYKGEKELLLSAGLRYRVISVTQSGYQTIVRVRVVPPPDGSV